MASNAIGKLKKQVQTYAPLVPLIYQLSSIYTYIKHTLN